MPQEWPKTTGSRISQLIECLHKKSRLGGGVPNSRPRPLTMSKARAVEADNAISLSKEVDESAGYKVLDHGTIAMEHH